MHTGEERWGWGLDGTARGGWTRAQGWRTEDRARRDNDNSWRSKRVENRPAV
jgi:hypothetical protein